MFNQTMLNESNFMIGETDKQFELNLDDPISSFSYQYGKPSLMSNRKYRFSGSK